MSLIDDGDTDADGMCPNVAKLQLLTSTSDDVKLK